MTLDRVWCQVSFGLIFSSYSITKSVSTDELLIAYLQISSIAPSTEYIIHPAVLNIPGLYGGFELNRVIMIGT